MLLFPLAMFHSPPYRYNLQSLTPSVNSPMTASVGWSKSRRLVNSSFAFQHRAVQTWQGKQYFLLTSMLVKISIAIQLDFVKAVKRSVLLSRTVSTCFAFSRWSFQSAAGTETPHESQWERAETRSPLRTAMFPLCTCEFSCRLMVLSWNSVWHKLHFTLACFPSLGSFAI